jgi:hypothetical protein
MLTFSHPGSRGQKGNQSRFPDPDPQHCCCVEPTCQEAAKTAVEQKRPEAAQSAEGLTSPELRVKNGPEEAELL